MEWKVCGGESWRGSHWIHDSKRFALAGTKCMCSAVGPQSTQTHFASMQYVTFACATRFELPSICACVSCSRRGRLQWLNEITNMRNTCDELTIIWCVLSDESENVCECECLFICACGFLFSICIRFQLKQRESSLHTFHSKHCALKSFSLGVVVPPCERIEQFWFVSQMINKRFATLFCGMRLLHLIQNGSFSVYLFKRLLSQKATSERPRTTTHSRFHSEFCCFYLSLSLLRALVCMRAYHSPCPITSYSCFHSMVDCTSIGHYYSYIGLTVQASSSQGTEALSVDFVFVVYTHRMQNCTHQTRPAWVN